jgi:alpha-tubulin suppressor-like RCC1 family protein
MTTNFLLISTKISSLNIFLDGVSCGYYVYSPSTTFLEIIDVLDKYTHDNNKSINSLGIVFDTSNIDTIFLNFNTFITKDLPNNITRFFEKIVGRYKLKTLDFLACNLLLHNYWRTYFYYLYKTLNIPIRASIDLTGNQPSNWVLENYNIDVKPLYFNQNIEKWYYSLDNYNISENSFAIIQKNNLFISGEFPHQYYFKHYIDYLFPNIKKITDKYILLTDTRLYHYTNGLIYIANNVNDIISNTYIDVYITDDSVNNMYLSGQNNNGQLGLGDNIDRVNFTRTNCNKKVIRVAIVKDYLVAILTSEVVNNLYVSGIYSSIFSPIIVNTCITDISGGENLLCAISTDIMDNLFIFNVDTNILTVKDHYGIDTKQVKYVSCGKDIVGVMTYETTNNFYILDNENFVNSGQSIVDIYVTYGNYFIYTVDNRLLCSGDNVNGSLGLGTLEQITDFIEISNFLSNNFVKFVWSVEHHVILAGNGNTFYSTHPCPNYFNKPLFNKNIVKISCGKSHTLIITDETINNLYVCGSNNNYATCLGINTGYTYDFIQIVMGKQIVDIYAGNENSFILTSETIDNLYVCGLNNYGQLGLPGNPITSLTNVPTGTYIRQCHGYDHSFYINSSNQIYFAGKSDYGQTTYKTSNLSSFTLGNNISNPVMKADIGDNHTVLLYDLPINNSFGVGDIRFSAYGKSIYTASIFKYGWKKMGFGLNSGGFTGRDDFLYFFGENSPPTKTTLKPSDFCFSENNQFIIVNGVVHGKGSNIYGQLGLGDFLNRNNYTIIPHPKRFKIVKTYNDTTALITVENELYMFGRNDYYQINSLTNTSINTPLYITDNILDVNIGNKFTTYVKNNGDVYIAGYFNTSYTEFTRLVHNISSVVCNGSNIFCIDKSGNLSGAGENMNGELGLGHNIPHYSLSIIGTHITSVTCGNNFSMYIRDGNVYTCGNRYTNGLGYEIYTHTYLMLGTYISSKYYHTIISDDTNSYIIGSVGDDISIPTQIITTERCVNLSCGSQSTSLISESGNLYGSGITGEAGGILYDTKLLLGNVKSVENYKDNSMVVINGNLYICGQNNSGQFGIGLSTGNLNYMLNPLVSNVELNNINYPIINDFHFRRPILTGHNYNISDLAIIDIFDNDNISINYSGPIVFGNTLISNIAGNYGITLTANNYLSSSKIANVSVVEPVYIYEYDGTQNLGNSILVGDVSELSIIYKKYSMNLREVDLCYISGNIVETLSTVQKLEAINLPENRPLFNLPRVESIDIHNYLKTRGHFVKEVLYNKYFRVLYPTSGSGTMSNPYTITFIKQFSSNKIGFYIPAMDGEIYKLSLYRNKYYYIRKTRDGYGEVLVNSVWTIFQNGDMLLIDNAQFVMYFSSIILYQSHVQCLTPEIDVLCSTGYVNVKELNIGDSVVTSDNRHVGIINIIKTHTLCDSEDNYPYLVRKNSINREYPSVDVRLSRNHLIYYKGFWVAPFQIPKIETEIVESITYYNIVLPNYKTDHLVINGGTIVESYGDNDSNNMVENKRRFSDRNYYYLTTLVKQLGNKELDKIFGNITNNNVFIYACQNNNLNLCEYLWTFCMKMDFNKLDSASIKKGYALAKSSGYNELCHYIESKFGTCNVFQTTSSHLA